MTKTIQKRQVAWKVAISDLVEGEYIKEEGEWQPNYVLFGQKRVARANVMGVVIAKEDSQFGSIMIDDGSAQIAVRSFEQHPGIHAAVPGSLVLVVGRPREYMNERYLVAEIVREIADKTWFELRNKELRSTKVSSSQQNDDSSPPASRVQEESARPQKEVAALETDAAAKEEAEPDEVCSLIKNKDRGQGVDLQEVVDALQREDAEEIIKRMLAQGELFEVQPGKVKVLE